MILSNLDAQIQDPGGTASKGEATTHSRRRCAPPSTTAKMRLLLCFSGSTGAVAPVLQARDCHLGPFPPDAYKRPLGVLHWRYPKFRVLMLVCF